MNGRIVVDIDSVMIRIGREGANVLHSLFCRDRLVSCKDSFIADDDVGVRIPHCSADKSK
jgi:hypothetical protein